VLIGDMGMHDTHSDPNESSNERWGWRRGQAEVGYLLEECYWGKRVCDGGFGGVSSGVVGPAEASADD
jgi:hypothetical protein